MLFQLLNSFQTSNSLLRIILQQCLNKICEKWTKMILNNNLIIDKIINHNLPVPIIEWDYSPYHFINNNTKGPEISSVVMFLFGDNFRCNINNIHYVFKIIFVWYIDFIITKIYYFDITFVVKQNIIGVKGAINYILFVDLFKENDQLTAIE